MTRKRQKPAKAPTYRGPDVKARALSLLGQGMTLSAIGRELGVDRTAVREWRDSPEGERFLAELRKAREKEFAGIVADGSRALRELVLRSVSVLKDKLESDLPFESITAAREVLDRAGLLRAERIEVAPGAKVVVLPALEPDEETPAA